MLVWGCKECAYDSSPPTGEVIYGAPRLPTQSPRFIPAHGGSDIPPSNYHSRSSRFNPIPAYLPVFNCQRTTRPVTIDHKPHITNDLYNPPTYFIHYHAQVHQYQSLTTHFVALPECSYPVCDTPLYPSHPNGPTNPPKHRSIKLGQNWACQFLHVLLFVTGTVGSSKEP